MKRVEKTAPPAYVEGVEDLIKSYSPSEPLNKKEKPHGKASVQKSDAYKACMAKAKSDGKEDPAGFCKMEMEKIEKAELGGPKQHKMGDEAFRDAPRQEAGDLLGTVRRNAKEKLQEKVGHQKEVAVYQKSDSDLDKAIEKMMQMSKAMPQSGQNYQAVKDNEKDMTVEDSKNLKDSPNWSSHKIMPMVHKERRDETAKYLNQRQVHKSEIDWANSNPEPAKHFEDPNFNLESQTTDKS